MSHAHRAVGSPDQARHHEELAVTLYTDLGSLDSDEARARPVAVYEPVDP